MTGVLFLIPIVFSILEKYKSVKAHTLKQSIPAPFLKFLRSSTFFFFVFAASLKETLNGQLYIKASFAFLGRNYLSSIFHV